MLHFSVELRRFWRRWCHASPHGRRRTRLQFERLEDRCTPAVAAAHTYVVTTTAYTTDISHLQFNNNGLASNNNGSPMSLFEAIAAIDAYDAKTGQYVYAGPSVIDFNIAGSGVHVFSMPTISEPTLTINQAGTTLNGYTQPGAYANTGSGASDNAHLQLQMNFRIDVTGSNDVIRGMAVRGIDLGNGQNNEVVGDFIGITPAGASMGVDLAGVTIGATATTATHASGDAVGSPAAADRNVISGHVGTSGNGVAILDGSHGNTVDNNLIGTDPTGTQAVGNAQDGVYFDTSATAANLIAGNYIAYNKGDAIYMAGGAQAHFTDNSIFANANGIVLASGVNNHLAAPVFTSWGPTSVTGHLASFTPNATYTVELFNNTATDPNGHYEGQTFETTAKVVPNSQGNFVVNVAQPGFGGITATVTDAQGDTSPFSAATDFNIQGVGGPTVDFVQGTTLSGALVGTITRDGNPNATIAVLQATVSWGDGTSSVLSSVASAGGQIVQGPNSWTYLLRGNHKYVDDGTYQIHVTVRDLVTTLQNTSLVTVAQVAADDLTAVPVPVTAVEGESFNGNVGAFTDPGSPNTAAAYSATIAWGDGQTSTGQVVKDSAGHFHVVGSHTYAEEGAYQVTTTVTQVGFPTPPTVKIASPATVQDAPLAIIEFTGFTVVEGAPYQGTLLGFADYNPNAPISDFKATINWGDGTTTTVSGPGAIVGLPTAIGVVPPQADFTVNGSHAYADAGTYTVKVTINDIGGSTVTGTVTATVTDAPLTLLSTDPVSVVEGTAFQGTLATFSDANPLASASNYTATINWGDGTTSTVAVVPLPSSTGFSVSGSHTYAIAGTYTVNVTITDIGGSTVSGTLTATVTDAPLTMLNTDAFSVVEGSAFQGTVATFSDANPLAPASDFNATINWGDGTTTTVSGPSAITQNPAPMGLAPGTPPPLPTFSVQGSHTYAEAGAYTVTVTVNDVGGATVTGTLAATVTEAPLTPVPVTIGPTEGATFTGTVASFTDLGANGSVAQYTATITWGDGHTTTASGAAGTIVAAGANSFNVLGTNTYASAGTYSMTVMVTDQGGATTTVDSEAVVQDAPLAGVPVSVMATANTSFTGPVATFTDSGGPAPVGNYSAVINWGDGTAPSMGTITVSGTTFTVSGTHTYASAGTPTITVQIADAGGATLSLQVVAEVVGAPVAS